jgi:predicted ArsR family transcriptional regulator
MVDGMSRSDRPSPAVPAIRAIAALDDDLRRRIHDFIRAARRPVTREEAAAAVGISRKLAAFHLDKLVAAGLLRTDYPHPSGVRKVGRAPKVYVPVDGDVRMSIPDRQHDVLATILIDAVLSGRASEFPSRPARRRTRAHVERGLAEPAGV